MTASDKKTSLLCLATQKGLTFLETAVRFLDRYRFYVCTFKEKNVLESYDERITTLALENGCEIITLKQFREHLIEHVLDKNISFIACIGWRFLIPPDVRRTLRGEVIVAHDSLLPALRGFAPLPTAMILGFRETGVTFMRAGDGVDDGDILWQGRFQIDPEDTIDALIKKTLPLYQEGAERYFQGDLNCTVSQRDADATFSIWRDEDDYQIDWSLDAGTIERTIRALGAPYLGARCRLRNQVVVLHRATELPDITFAIRQPGKVWCRDESGRPIVVCGSGLLRIDAATADGKSIIPLDSLRVRFT